MMPRIIWLLIASVGYCLPANAETARPNVVLFLVDDLGWADLGCYGSSFHETPHIDALAAGGSRFTNAYAACPVCSPTRASILTGRHPVRVNITDWIPGMDANRVKDRKFEHVDDRDHLALEEVTLAEHLRDVADYQTFFLGKWHLGDTGHLPTDQGFDVNIGGFDRGSPPGGYYGPWKNPHLTANFDGEYLTTRLTDEATGLIEDADRDRPFFLMMSYYNVHSPITADRTTINHFRKKANATFEGPTPSIDEGDAISRARQDNPDYASMVAAVDTSVGRILASLRQSGVDDNTIVVFFSDNGGLCTVRKVGPTSNLPLRSGKGWLYEGGIREPMIVRLPSQLKTANAAQVIDDVACSTDLFPTILDAIGLPLQANLHADGSSLLSVMRRETPKTRSLYWHYPHYHGSLWKPGAAIRNGNMKLIEFYERGEVELYDLSEDIGETNNLADERPDVRDALRKELQAWQRQMGAQMPVARVEQNR